MTTNIALCTNIAWCDNRLCKVWQRCGNLAMVSFHCSKHFAFIELATPASMAWDIEQCQIVILVQMWTSNHTVVVKRLGRTYVQHMGRLRRGKTTFSLAAYHKARLIPSLRGKMNGLPAAMQ